MRPLCTSEFRQAIVVKVVYKSVLASREKVARDVNIYGIRFRRCVHFGIRLGHHMKIQLEGKENIIRL